MGLGWNLGEGEGDGESEREENYHSLPSPLPKLSFSPFPPPFLSSLKQNPSGALKRPKKTFPSSSSSLPAISAEKGDSFLRVSQRGLQVGTFLFEALADKVKKCAKSHRRVCYDK